MSNQHTDRVARVERRKSVAKLYLKGWTQAEIAEKVGKSQATISHDLQILQKEWRRASVKAFEARHAIEVRKMDALERVLWEAWEASLEPKRKVEITKDIETKKETHRSSLIPQNGDPRFLEQVRKCVIVRGAVLQPRAAQEPPDAETDLSVRRDRLIAVALALREQYPLPDDREESDSVDAGDVRYLGQSDEIPPPAAPPPA